MEILLHIMSFDVHLVMFATQLFEFDPTLAISTLVVVLMMDDVYVQIKWRQVLRCLMHLRVFRSPESFLFK